MIHYSVNGVFEWHDKAVQSNFSIITKYFSVLGLLSLMYALLHHSGTARISPSPFPLSEMTISILTSVLRLINLVALLDLNSLQVFLQLVSFIYFQSTKNL